MDADTLTLIESVHATPTRAVLAVTGAGSQALAWLLGVGGASRTVLEATVRDSERALELAQIQFRVGSTDLRAVEQNQLALYSARTARLRVQTERLAQRVNLHLALGGGFDEPALGPVAAQ